MRLFIAVEVPEDVKNHILSVEEQLKNKEDKIKWVKKENLHLTLKFLGEVSEQKTDNIMEALKEIEFEKFEANLSELGAFPSMTYIRVLWVGLEPHEKINLLQKQVEEKLQPLSFKKDDRFHPHLTIARVKFIKHKQQFVENLKQIQVEKLTFPVDKIRLIKSTLTKHGPIYEVLQEFG